MLTIPEEFLLLMAKDDDGGFITLAPSAQTAVFVGAALMELALQDRIDSDLKGIWVLDRKPTGEPCVDLVLARIASPVFDMTSDRLIDQLVGCGHQVRELALERLCERSMLKREEGRILWFLKARRYPVINGKGAREAKLRILEILLRDQLPNPRDVCLLALADGCDIIKEFVPPFDIKRASERLATIAKMDLIGQSAANYIRIVKRTTDFSCYGWA